MLFTVVLIQGSTLQALRLMHRTVDIVFKEEPLLASTVEFDQSGLIALIEASQNPLDPKECVAVLSKLAQKLLPIEGYFWQQNNMWRISCLVTG